MKRLAVIALGLLNTLPACAWELLITRDGVMVEGNITQEEFLMVDQQGIETAIPRASVAQFEIEGEQARAQIKDGTMVVGTLEGKIEIEEGMVKKRFAMSDIRFVAFDRFITIEHGKKYATCPIRIEIGAAEALFGEKSRWETRVVRHVQCKGLSVQRLVVDRDRGLKPGKSLDLRFVADVAVPEGEDQLVDVSIQVLQGDRTVARRSARREVDENELGEVSFPMVIPANRLDPSGEAPRFLLQVIHQESKRKIEQGGFFWWFTIPIPLG